MSVSDESNLINEVLMASEIMHAQDQLNKDNKALESECGYEFFEIDTTSGDVEELVDLLLGENESGAYATTDEDIESLIELDTTLTIQNVVNLYEILKRSYAVNDAIEINASKVISIDTATLQLLVALKKDAIKNQKQVAILEPSLRFVESARLLGLLDELGVGT